MSISKSNIWGISKVIAAFWGLGLFFNGCTVSAANAELCAYVQLNSFGATSECSWNEIEGGGLGRGGALGLLFFFAMVLLGFAAFPLMR